MIQVFLKEVRSFLSSLIAYIVIVVFLTTIGLFMWVYPDTNVLDMGHSNLDTLFYMAPWVFIFLVSAITMRSISEEVKTGTIESLTTLPLKLTDIIGGKFLASWFLVIIALVPTLLYYYTIYQLGATPGNLDVGATWGSYIGLILLGAAYASIGLFASSLSDNQIVSFLISVFLCFFMLSAFQQLSALSLFKSVDYWIEWLGIDFHYQSISRGVVDTRDVVYFLSLIGLFLALTWFNLQRKLRS
jgi:ABC-2 type transport system permease protein